jgi:hypothetical protein
MRMRTRWLASLALAGFAVAALGSPAALAKRDQPEPNPLEGEGEGLELIKNIPWNGGSDFEIATIKGRDYLFAGSYASILEGGGLHVIDITNPEKAKEVAWLKCAFDQADVQISHDKKTLIFASDGTGGPEACLGTTRIGFMTVDIRNPRKPRPLGFAEIPRGSHNTTAHPTLPYVYNSDADLEGLGEIQIWSIKDPKKPELVNTISGADVPGHSPHDLSFSPDGSMMVTAAISHWDIYDTSEGNVEDPQLLWTGQCPGYSITHDAKFTPDMKRVVIGDEGGGGLTYPCPGGALYFYDLNMNAGRPVPVLTGAFEPAELVATPNGPGGCTSHVFDISDDSKLLSISWYTAGTYLLDITSSVGTTVGDAGAPTGVVQRGWFQPTGGSSWSSKMHEGPYVYSNDQNRGLDIYKFAESAD